MAEGAWHSVLWAGLIGLGLSWLLEGLLRPRPIAPWKRPGAASTLHIGLFLLGYAIELLLFRRPIFGVANLILLQAIVIFVSNTKEAVLREPFLYQDIEYFIDALRHPRLYLAFLSIWVVVLPAAAYAGACWIAFRYEPSVIRSPWHLPGYVLLLAGLALAGWLFCVRSEKTLETQISFEAGDDLRGLGLLSVLWLYGRVERRIPAPEPRKWPKLHRSVELPDLISVQSESFFDARQFYPALKLELLDNFDRLRREARAFGEVNVPAWGANTVRSEFAFLSGWPGESLGVHRFNPYRKLALAGVPSIAQHLHTSGYRTVCIHPYHADFYRRDKVLPQLGFEEFIHLEAFNADCYAGPYVGDLALARRALAELDSDDPRPVYLHLITMENHGPLHWEKVTEACCAEVARAPLPHGCNDLIAYARHLRNADAMFGMLSDQLQQRDKPASVCIYGDHVPIMASVYEALGQPVGTTPYVIWDCHQALASRPSPCHRDLPLHELAMYWLAYLNKYDKH